MRCPGIEVTRGEVRTSVSQSSPSEFYINTPNADGKVSGDADLFVFYKKSVTGALVKEGTLFLAAGGSSDEVTEVKGGYTAILSAGEEALEPRRYMDVEIAGHEDLTAPALSAAVASDEKGEVKAVVIKISGAVLVKRAGSGEWTALYLRDELATGDQLQTKEDGMVEFRLDNGNTMALKSGTTIVMTKLTADPQTGEYDNIFDAKFGKIMAKVQKLKGA